jgi:hypothetical protein
MSEVCLLFVLLKPPTRGERKTEKRKKGRWGRETQSKWWGHF